MSEQTIILCYGDDDECVNCGGSAERRYRPERIDRTDYGGPWCCLECHDESIEFAARAKAERAAAWCSSCGYDNHEHRPGCAAEVRAEMEER